MALVLGVRSRILFSISRRNSTISPINLTWKFLRNDGKKLLTQRGVRASLGFGFLSGIYLFSNRMNAAHCADNENSSSSNDKDPKKLDPVSSLIEQFSPLINRLGLGGLIGVCAGYASKRIGKEFAFYAGCGFIILQVNLRSPIHYMLFTLFI
jgi:hypothetical protein